MSNINITPFYSKGYENAELIKVTTNEQGQKLVSARELYLGLGLNKAVWKRWYETNIIANEYFKENVDWVGFNIMLNGNETQDFAISLEFAKHIAMMARTEKSHEYRNYFIECEKVAHNPYANLSPELQMLIKLEQGQTVLNQRVDEQKQDFVEFKQEFQNFKEEQYIAQAQCKQISNRVKSLGTKLLGGKKSPAYQDKSLRAQVYSDIYSQVHREFGVKSCADIKCKDYSAVFSVIHNYSLPMHLLNDIEYAINQMSLEI